MHIDLDPLETLLLALGCLLLGRLLNQRIGLLGQYNIPAPVTGGLLCAAALSVATVATDWHFETSALLKPILLLMFFGGVGLGADLRQLVHGGRALLRFIAVLLPFICLQNALGVLLALLLDMHPVFGLVAGSVTQVGGHGTGAAYAERFAEVYNLQSVMELSMTAATIGLILGGILAGPVAQYLISRHRLRGESQADTRPSNAVIDPLGSPAMILALASILLALVAGQKLAAVTAGLPVMIPEFLWCMITGVMLRNLLPFAGVRFDDRAAELVAGVCLALFLVMAMMELDLAAVIRSAGPLLMILVLQAAFVAAYTILVAFRVLGGDYEAAVSSAALVGFSMGSTATAIANMQAVAARYGAARMAYLVVPLVGAFFVDLLNAGVITMFLSLSWVVG